VLRKIRISATVVATNYFGGLSAEGHYQRR
jgi:hypothetical protein